MNFTIRWSVAARDHLAEIWTQAPNRNAVTLASDRAERLLERDPLARARPLVEGLYALDEPPLRFLVEIDTAQRIVDIVAVNWLP